MSYTVLIIFQQCIIHNDGDCPFKIFKKKNTKNNCIYLLFTLSCPYIFQTCYTTTSCFMLLFCWNTHQTSDRQYALENTTQSGLLLLSHVFVFACFPWLFCCWVLADPCLECARGVYCACVYRPLVCMTSEPSCRRHKLISIYIYKWSKRERRQWDQRQRERGCHAFKSAETKGRGDCGSSCQFQYTTYLFQAGERCHSQDVLGSHVLSCHCRMRQYSTLLH